MKRTFTLLAAMLLMASVYAQTLVSTQPENKKAVLEEFTGTGCPNCPAGHTEAAAILAANPGKVIVIAYHPSNSSYTASDPMASSYAAAFYTVPFISSGNRFMPSAIINRRAWNAGDRIQDRNQWSTCVNTILGEASPLNVGVTSNYDEGTKSLTITAEAYFTGTVTENLTVYCMLIEDGIVATQSGGTSPYTHNHVFRKAMVAQWGDPVATPTTSGELKSFTFTYDNSTTNYVMGNCEVVVMIRNAANEEIISGNIAPVGESSPIGINEDPHASAQYQLYPNPVTEASVLSVVLQKSQPLTVKVFDLTGQMVAEVNHGTLAAGTHQIAVEPIATLPAGIYVLSVEGSETPWVQKIVITR
ncbi:MAG TPA: Omp28-related outer membrane protein [Bacteroidales bacterium]|nr:Omp28-related outer membrane protein [Bacteroidales bacterium]HRZ47821.1 Omp28-related outer membrane protein [Bacteroidales bacterium]